MNPLLDLTEQLIRFAEMGNQQKITLANGQVIQGWIMEIGENGVLMSSGYGDKHGSEQWLNFEQLQDAELDYFDTTQQQWCTFPMTSADK